MSRQGALEDERGFTLIEVIMTIVLIGIVVGLSSYTWFGIVVSRNVDSATNQVAADLRTVHSQSTNRLADYSFVAAANSSTYQVGPTGGTLVSKTLPDGTQIADMTTVVFKADGSAQVTGANPITIRSSEDTTNNHTIEVNTVTSRIKVVP